MDSDAVSVPAHPSAGDGEALSIEPSGEVGGADPELLGLTGLPGLALLGEGGLLLIGELEGLGGL